MYKRQVLGFSYATIAVLLVSTSCLVFPFGILTARYVFALSGEHRLLLEKQTGDKVVQARTQQRKSMDVAKIAGDVDENDRAAASFG